MIMLMSKLSFYLILSYFPLWTENYQLSSASNHSTIMVTTATSIWIGILHVDTWVDLLFFSRDIITAEGPTGLIVIWQSLVSHDVCREFVTMEADSLELECRILLLVLVAPSESSPLSSVSIRKCLPGIRLPSENIANKIMTPFIDIIIQSSVLCFG